MIKGSGRSPDLPTFNHQLFSCKKVAKNGIILFRKKVSKTKSVT